MATATTLDPHLPDEELAAPIEPSLVFTTAPSIIVPDVVAPPCRRKRWRPRLTIPLLLLLTVIAGGLRFVSLDRPTIWGDEAATYGRVAGTYQDLLEQMYVSSFPPLHYETLWWLRQGMPYWGHMVPRIGVSPGSSASDADISTFEPTSFLVPGGIALTPFLMRLIPAIAGTLFIPAIYFLSRQLFGPRVSLLTAFLACFSAYLLVYSRDAKMYMPFWLMCVLNIGCLLWWLRARRPLPWLLWVASGIAMLGWHASGFTLLAFNGVIFFSSPRLHWRKLMAFAGLIIWPVAALPIYGLERLRRRYDLVDWVRWDHFISWPRRAWRDFRWPAMVWFGGGIIIILSSMFGPLGFYSAFDGVYSKTTENSDATYDASTFGIDWVARYNDGRRLSDYLLYTSSAYLTGWEWPRHVPEMNLDDQATINPRTLRLLQGSTIGLLGLLAIGAVPWRRAFSPARARLDRITQDGLVAPAYRRRRVWWVAVWLVAVPWVTYTQSTERPVNILDGVADLVLINPPVVQWPRAAVIQSPAISALTDLPTLDHRNVITGTYEDARDAIATRWDLLGRSFAPVQAKFPAAWEHYLTGFRKENLSRVGIILLLLATVCLSGLTIWKWRSLGHGALSLLAVCAVMIVLGTPIAVLPRWLAGDVWMPRYLGVILPAFFMLAAVLIARQPTRWLPAATMILFVIVNLAQFGARVFGYSEPPTDLMAADLIAAQPHSIIDRNPALPTFRAYTRMGRPLAEPGGSGLFNPAGFYYLHVLSGWKEHGRMVREGEFDSLFNVWRVGTPAQVQQDLDRSPQISSFVVWSTLPPDQIDQTDPLADLLAGRFRRTGEQIWPVFDHWRWLPHPQVRRRSYVRIPATQP